MFAGIVVSLLCLGIVVLGAPPSIGRVPTERWFLPKTTVTHLRTITTTENMRPSCVHFAPGPETCEKTRMARISPTSAINSNEMTRSSIVQYDPLTELSPSPSMSLEILQDDSTQHKKISSPKFFNNWSFESTVTKVVMVMETKRVLDPSNVVTFTANGCSPAPPNVPICEEDIISPSTQDVIMSTIVPMATDTLIAVDEKVSVTPKIDIEENSPTLNPGDIVESNGMTTIGLDEQGTAVEEETTEENLPTNDTKMLDSESGGKILDDNKVITTTEISVTTVTLSPEKTELDVDVAEIQKEVTTINEPEEKENKLEQGTENIESREIGLSKIELGEKQDNEAAFEDEEPEENQLLGLEVPGVPNLDTLSVTEAVEISTLPEDTDSEVKKDVTVTTSAPQDDELMDRTSFLSTLKENEDKITPAFIAQPAKNGLLELSQINKNNDPNTANGYLLESSSAVKSSETLPEVNSRTETPEDTVMVSVIVEDNAEKSTTIINDIIKAQDTPISTNNLPQVEETLSSIFNLLPARQDNLA